MKGLGVTKIVKQIMFEEVWGELEAKICFERQSFTRYLVRTLVFSQKNALREKFDFCFSIKSFLLVLTKFSFWQED